MQTDEIEDGEVIPMDEIETAGNALVRAQKGGSAALVSREAPSLLDLAMRDQMAAVVRFSEGVESVRAAAVRSTEPADWVLMKPPNGEALGLLKSAGCLKVRPLLGIVIEKAEGWKSLEPVREEDDKGVVSYRLRARVSSRLMGGDPIEVESSRNGLEGFTGRRVDEYGNFVKKDGQAYEPDLKNSCSTGLQAKAIRSLFGLQSVPVSYLDACWKGTAKKGENCTKGSGFGSSKERSEDVSADDLEALRKKLRDAVLERCKGDTTAAQGLLYKITKYKGSDDKEYGYRTVDKMNKAFQFEKALKELANLKEDSE